MSYRKYLLVFIILALTVVGAGAANAQSPRVPEQEPGPDGGLVHVVNFGDTLASILAAYAPYGVTMERLQELNGWRFPPQFIYVDEQIVILPPGSVTPGSGVSVPAGVGQAAPPPASVTVTPAGGAPPADVPPAATPAPASERLTVDQIAAIAPVEAIAPFLP